MPAVTATPPRAPTRRGRRGQAQPRPPAAHGRLPQASGRSRVVSRQAVRICSSETGRGCCPHPRVTAVAKKTATAAPLALSLDRERDLGRKRERIEKGGEVNQGVTVLPRWGNRSCLRASSVRTCRGGTEASDSSYRASWPPSR